MQVKDVMAYKVEIVHPDDTLADAAGKLKTSDRDVLPVYEGDRLVGMLTARELQEHARKAGLAAGGHSVREAMSTDVASVYDDEDVRTAMKDAEATAQTRQLQNVLVLDRERHPVGIVGLDAMRRQIQEEEGDGTSAVDAVESISSIADYGEDRVDFMSDESFPASDPPPAPTKIAPCHDEDK